MSLGLIVDWPAIWDWLLDGELARPANIATVLLFFAAVIGWCWRRFKGWRQQKSETPPAPTVTADRGRIAVGGNFGAGGVVVIGTTTGTTTITTGPSEADMERFADKILAKQDISREAKIKELSHALGIRDQAVASFFRTLEEKEVPPERWAERLAKIAQLHLRLIEEVRVLRSDDPAIRRLRDEALAALETGDNAEAEEALIEARALVRQKRERLAQASAEQAVEEAKIEGVLGDLAMKQLRYLVAAQRYAAAAALMPSGHQEQRLAYLDLEVGALLRQGHEFGDNAALGSAIERCQALLRERPPERMPLEWAMTQNNLSLAFRTLGERELSTNLLEKALRASRQAFEVCNRRQVPLAWALTLKNVADALARLGERESGTARLEEAIGAYRAALEECTRERMPVEWASIQNNLGNVLLEIAEREQGTERLREAEQAYVEALKEHTRDRMPLDWATTQMSLGNALLLLSERTSSKSVLQKAISAFRLALEKLTRERTPLKWAMTQCNLGNALASLGEQEGDPKRLEEAIEAYQQAFEECTRQRMPLDWASTQDNLGTVLRSLGELMGDKTRLEGAIEAHRQALAVFEQAGAMHQAEKAQGNLDKAKRSLRGLSGDI